MPSTDSARYATRGTFSRTHGRVVLLETGSAMQIGSPYQAHYSASWALLIGINKYKYTSPLNFAINDAKAVANLLETRFGFPRKNISLLLDHRATKDAIRKCYSAYANDAKIRPDDRLFIFFAGHGHTITGKRGEVGFLVPVDGKTNDVNSLIRWDELTRAADLIPAKHIFFLMDACYGGLALLRSPAFGSMRFLGDMLQRYARQVLTAGKADETVADGSGVRPGHSIFTAHLLDALDGSAATEQGVITANGVMAYVYDRVARDQYSHQTPHYGFIDGDGDFVFDTSLLDSLRISNSQQPAQEGDKDILINTSPQLQLPTDSRDAPIVASIKELLSDPSKKIKLDDFVSLHIRHFLDATDLRHFPVQGGANPQSVFPGRATKYDELSKDLQQIVILLGKWANSEQLALLERIVSSLAEADKGSAGYLVLLQLTWFPLLILMYSAGIAALASRKYDALRIVLETRVHGSTTGTSQPVVIPVVDNLTELHDMFKLIPGHERHLVPRSEYLFKALQPELEDLLFLGRRYELLFDKFEVLLALEYFDIKGSGWGPMGRFLWKHRHRAGDSPIEQVMEEAKKEGENWGPIRAGLFQASQARFVAAAGGLLDLMKQIHW